MIDMTEPIETRACGCKFLPRLNKFAERCEVHAENPLAPVCAACEKTGALTPAVCGGELCPTCFASHSQADCDACNELAELEADLDDLEDNP